MDTNGCGQGERLHWFDPREACGSIDRPGGPPTRLALLGPPGVGKGTQAELICRRYRACHLSTGDLFRAASGDANPSPAMGEALDAMRRGDLVADELVTRLVRERSGCVTCGGGFLLDGVPRTLSQAEALTVLFEEVGVRLDGVVLYELGEGAITARLGGRRTCASCNAVFHVTARPPRRDGVCDSCGGELVQRQDDRPDVIRKRFEAYREATEPLREYYEQRGELVIVAADAEPDEVFQRTCDALDQRKPTPQ